LKNIISQHKPDIILLSEPWMDIEDLPRRWLVNLNLKCFASNTRPHNLPNLWCLCKLSLTPTILASSDQHVTFTITDNNNTLAFSAIYASTNYLTRRTLWNELNSLQAQHDLPWCFLGDFNVIMGAHEHRSRSTPARLPIAEFQSWTDSFNLIHLHTKGAAFTWSNGRGGNRHTERRLDRVVCNQRWLDLCCVSTVNTISKLRSDHFPILLDFQLSMTSFASQFKFMKMWSLHPSCKDVISDSWNSVVVGCPMFVLSQKLKSLKAKLKTWNKECFGNVNEMVTAAELHLQQVQMQIQVRGHNDTLLQEEKTASANLEDALSKQEAFWQEKARLTWHLEGDRNTKYFHRLAKIKTSTKHITSLQDGATIITDQNRISDHVVNFYKNLFCANVVLQDSVLAEDVIPSLVNDDTNAILTMLPSHSEIKAAVFALNKDSAPGPDGFGAFFFQNYWDIVKTDVINAVLEFFTSSWILPGFNSNIIALLPKFPEAASIDQFRPIAMANFKFKIISKILADRLASIMPNIISEEQKGFIHGRDIRDCLCIASEAANFLHNKSFGGNLALKIDIAKAFDTLDWNFLLKVLKTFGFNDIFCNWIHVILKSAFLSISINGKSHGYFNCTRGVRQGDPLSPLLFCLAEDVLSRSISKLVSQGSLQLIKGTRKVSVPSHSFYADDLMIYCKGQLSGLRALNDLFAKYASESGQCISHAKSTIYSGSITPRRLDLIVALLNFKIGSMPFHYLGVPIFKGKPKASHLQPIADKIKLKFLAWKASLLSIAGRVQLVKSVIQSMLTYSISIYSWPVSLLKDLERCIRNFIWSGDLDQRKLVTVSWKKVCRPMAQGGLNIRSLIQLNEASNLRMCWCMLNSQASWASLLRDRVIKNGRAIRYHVFSSLWSGIKDQFAVILDNSVWLLGNGNHINFWTDRWCGDPLVEQLAIPHNLRDSLTSLVSDFILNGEWCVPSQLAAMFPNLYSILSKVSIPLEASHDKFLWKHTDTGDLELKQAYVFKTLQSLDLPWAKHIWQADIPPSKSLMVWRLMHGKMPTDENLMARGCAIPSICNLCNNHVETSFHLFFECPFAVKLWSWLAGCLDITIQFYSMDDIWKLCDNNWAAQSKVTLTAAIVNLLNTIWFARNQARFSNTHLSWRNAIARVMASTSLTGSHTLKTSSNSIRDFNFLKAFQVSIHPPRPSILREVIWCPPMFNWLKCNIDGASCGNPGNAACGGVFRNHAADFVYGFAEPLGVMNAFVAEMCGAMRAVEIAFQNNWHRLWIESDSLLVVSAFNHPDKQVAWSISNRWRNTIYKVKQMNVIVTHIFREGNQVADIFANHGLSIDSIAFWFDLPYFARECFVRNKQGSPSFRICNS
jgi:ribonuclease HI